MKLEELYKKIEAIRIIINMYHDTEAVPPEELYKWRRELVKQRNEIESTDWD